MEGTVPDHSTQTTRQVALAASSSDLELNPQTQLDALDSSAIT
jgi:hypothetical protein